MNDALVWVADFITNKATELITSVLSGVIVSIVFAKFSKFKRLKRWLAVVISIVIFILSTLGVFFIVESSRKKQECVITAQYSNGQLLEEEKDYEIVGGETINVSATSNAGIAFTGYHFNTNGTDTETIDKNSNTITIILPPRGLSGEVQVHIEAVAKNDDGTPNTITKTGWKKYRFRYVGYPVNMTTQFSDGSLLEENQRYNVHGGESITVSATCNRGIASICYYYNDKSGNTDIIDVRSNVAEIVVPKKQKYDTTTLYITSIGNDDMGFVEWKPYILDYIKP